MNAAASTNNPVEIPQEQYPIRTVAAITGVNPVTLRAWERRYGLFKPQRTPKGHRLYNQTDIELINRVVRLLDRGVSISQVNSHLQARPTTVDEDQPAESPWQEYHARAIDAIVCFDEEKLDSLYSEALALYPVDVVTDRLMAPVLASLGKRWEEAEGSVAEEHFFSAFMRNKLGARFHHRYKPAQGSKLLVSCMPGEHHEIGAMLFALAAHDHGYRIVYLGPDMPFTELDLTASRARCDAIVISGSVNPGKQSLRTDLRQLANSAACPVFVGGQASVRQHDAIEHAGANPLGTDIRNSIRRITQLLELPQKKV